MKLRAAWLGVLAIFVGMSFDVPVASATMRITDDPGGRIVTYMRKFAGLRESGERVIIDGTCASACTIVLGAVPRERICITSRARLGFHAAWEFGEAGRPVTNPMATRFLLAMYPASVRGWIKRRGGLNGKMIYLGGRELAAMYPRCGTETAGF
jgi:hypothetical protein